MSLANEVESTLLPPSPKNVGRGPAWLFAAAIFCGAFLLFQVQPLIGKYVLPWFGGGPAVWTTCMLFFQVLLLGGYAYAHLLSRLLTPRAQAIVHVALLLVAMSFMPIWPSDRWKPYEQGNPSTQILLLLTACIGLPYFVLSATGPLMQAWFGRVCPRTSPYRLYALSNVGSLLALLTFPFVFEPTFSRRQQAIGWSIGLGVFTLLCAACARLLWGRAVTQQSEATEGSTTVSEGPDSSGSTNPTALAAVVEPAVGGVVTYANPSLPTASGAGPVTTRWAPLFWLLLPACASALLLAVTNKLCQDVAVVPFLWILPLSLYLLSFIICFDSPRWYVRSVFVVLTAVFVYLLCGELDPTRSTQPEDSTSLIGQLLIFGGALFGCCMLLHGELVRLKPPVERLTGFYLTIAAGGALGGLMVSVVAPLVLRDFFELHIDVVLIALLVTLAIALDPASNLRSEGRTWPWPGGRLAVAVIVVLTVGTLLLARDLGFAVRTTLQMSPSTRNFYGVLRVFDVDRGSGNVTRMLKNGGITHGGQFKRFPLRAEPVTYYSQTSGVGLATQQLQSLGPVKIGVVGLGVGTIAGYGRKEDSIRFYEINPAVAEAARQQFWYLKDCGSKDVQVVLGDARLSLEREKQSQQFDLLVLDAFSSDAIPVHLLTREAFDLYNRHLKPNGIVAIHISNRHLDLAKVVYGVGRLDGYTCVRINDERDPRTLCFNSVWMLMSRDPQSLAAPAIHNRGEPASNFVKDPYVWTDDHTDLFGLLQHSAEGPFEKTATR